MKTSTLCFVMLALVGCAHTKNDEMTAEEHRAEASKHQDAAAQQEAQYNPNETRPVLAPRSPFVEDAPGLHSYNPTAEHLNQADREMARAFEHLKAAQALEKYEDSACAGISPAERSACPLLAPFVEAVEEGSQGLTLHLKASAPAKRIAAQMGCHLAYAQANGFDRTPCPLYVKGVKIAMREDRLIDVKSTDGTVATEVRLEGRRMFGEPAASPAK